MTFRTIIPNEATTNLLIVSGRDSCCGGVCKGNKKPWPRSRSQSVGRHHLEGELLCRGKTRACCFVVSSEQPDSQGVGYGRPPARGGGNQHIDRRCSRARRNRRTRKPR